MAYRGNIMDWIQFSLFFAAMAGMFFWNRAETRADRLENRNDIRHLDGKIDNLISAIQTETKDFHGRLCSLEGKLK
jgi:hypothetical protein